MWYVRAMGIRKHHPAWMELERIELDDGRPAGQIRVPTSDTDIVEIVLPLPMLGQLVAEADEIREAVTAP